jgi:hypothetical protein
VIRLACGLYRVEKRRMRRVMSVSGREPAHLEHGLFPQRVKREPGSGLKHDRLRFGRIVPSDRRHIQEGIAASRMLSLLRLRPGR